MLGENSLIPGFEEEIIGLKKDEETGRFSDIMFQENFGMQVHYNNECKLTFYVPKDRFIKASQMIFEKGLNIDISKVSFG